METTRVAIVGLGTVGTGVARLLLEQSERLTRHSGRRLELAKVVVRDLRRPRQLALPEEMVTDQLETVVQDPQIQVVAQLIGGLEPARRIMLRLLDSGKDIVTANKALLAEHGGELFDRARELGRSIAFEASVAGGIPIITSVGQCLSANEIGSLRAILNGTSNFILSKMESGAEYEAAVSDAQRLGYAEADPTMDVDGTDAAQKLAILAQLAFGARMHWSEIPRQGIQSLEVIDLHYARELGYRIKLLAVAQLSAGELELHVSPTLVRCGQPLAEVQQAFNAISVVGDAVGRVFFHGPGAGQMATASAVVADIIDTAVGRTKITFRTLNLWSQPRGRVELRDSELAPGRYYLRLLVEDHPGVLAEIAGVLGSHGISIASLIQHEPHDGEDEHVPLVIMTHTSTAGAVARALAKIDRLSSVRAGSVCMRVLD